MPTARPLIAIVDDEEPIRKALKRLLFSAGFEVETFASGPEFLQFLPTLRPDCLLLDLHLSGLDGYQILALLARTDLSLPVIILTGQDSDETRNRVLAWRPVAYLRKPVHDQNLFDAIALALTQSSGQLPEGPQAPCRPEN